MNLKRQTRPRALISLVPMVDVMLILLVFFMVTSTYLNLDMIPAVRPSDDGAATTAQAPPEGTVMIRIGADGIAVLRGQEFDIDALASHLTAKIAVEPLIQVLILPSGAAPMQALISVMDAAALAGVQRLRVLRLDGLP